ncbi:hypothetical protein [Mycobacterium sp. MS1601]|uniref:hypothetical protein n=1 Tax=Mycobacterium sp. MS1601 TaxID=1936029 RepID=UPI0012FB8463|nr:hypothetical protein [Mycobacterium sp. MS1601]
MPDSASHNAAVTAHRRRVAALALHPDRGGDHDAFIDAMRAIDEGGHLSKFDQPIVVVRSRRVRMRKVLVAMTALVQRRRVFVDVNNVS